MCDQLFFNLCIQLSIVKKVNTQATKIEFVCYSRYTPLMESAREGYRPMVALMIEHGMSIYHLIFYHKILTFSAGTYFPGEKSDENEKRFSFLCYACQIM